MKCVLDNMLVLAIVHVTGFEEETLNYFKGSYIIAIIFSVKTRIVGEVGLRY